MAGEQLVPYWNRSTKQFEGPGNVPGASVENLQAVQATAASTTLPLGIAHRAGRIREVRVAAITAATGNATYTVDVRKNGTTVLTGVATLDNTIAARASVLGSLVATAAIVVAPGDFFEAVTVSTPGAGAAPANIVISVELLQN